MYYICVCVFEYTCMYVQRQVTTIKSREKEEKSETLKRREGNEVHERFRSIRNSGIPVPSSKTLRTLLLRN